MHGQVSRFCTIGGEIHHHVVKMQVVVAVARDGRFRVEGNHHRIIDIIGQGDGDFLTGGGDLVEDIVAVAVVAPHRGIGSTPSMAEVGGDNHHEFVIHLRCGIGNGRSCIVGSEGEIEDQHRIRQAVQIDGRGH